MTTILVLCDQEQRVEAQLSLILGLKHSFRFVVLFSRGISRTSIEKFRRLSCDCIEVDNIDREKNCRNISPGFGIQMKGKFKGKERGSVAILFRSLIVYLLLLIRHRKLERFVRKHAPSVIIVNGDRGALGDEQVVLKIAKKMGIPSFMPYFAHISDGVAIRKDKRRYFLSTSDSISKRIIYRGFSDQAIEVDGEKMFFYVPEVLMALKMYGSLSSYPWTMGNGLLDVVCVDSHRNLHVCTSQRVEINKIKVVGDVQYDILFDRYQNRSSIKERLLENYGMSASRDTVILAMPQLAEHKIMDWENHWNEIDFLVESLEKEDKNLLISLHPKADREKYRYLEANRKCRILDESLKEVLPIADLFIATFSSTVIWAILCGIKTIVVDFYGFGYEVFKDLSSVFVVRDKAILKKALEESYSRKVDFESDWRLLSRDSVFDGKTMKRYRDLLNDLANNQRESY